MVHIAFFVPFTTHPDTIPRMRAIQRAVPGANVTPYSLLEIPTPARLQKDGVTASVHLSGIGTRQSSALKALAKQLGIPHCPLPLRASSWPEVLSFLTPKEGESSGPPASNPLRDMGPLLDTVKEGLEKGQSWGELVPAVAPLWKETEQLTADQLRFVVNRTAGIPERCPPEFAAWWETTVGHHSWEDRPLADRKEEAEEIPTMKKEADAGFEELYLEAESINDKLVGQLKAARAQIESLQQSAEEQSSRALHQVTEARKEAHRLEEELESLRGAGNREQALMETLQEREAVLQQQQRHVAELTKQVQKRDEDIASYKAELLKLREQDNSSELKVLRAELEKAHKDKTQLRGLLEKSQQEHHREKETCAHWQTKHVMVEETAERLRNEVATLKLNRGPELLQARKTIEELEKKLATLATKAPAAPAAKVDDSKPLGAIRNLVGLFEDEVLSYDAFMQGLKRVLN